jgi:hypothetical protein
MANMIPISTITVGSAGTSILQFNNIPQNYTDLMVKLSTKSEYTGTLMLLRMKINGYNAFTWKSVVAEGTTTGSYIQTSYGADVTTHGTMVGTVSATTNTFGVSEIYISNYGSNNYKSYTVESVSEGTFTGSFMWLLGGLYSSNSPITSLTVYPETSNFAQYTTATLYGIRKY